jgi:hypothetical protein
MPAPMSLQPQVNAALCLNPKWLCYIKSSSVNTYGFPYHREAK